MTSPENESSRAGGRRRGGVAGLFFGKTGLRAGWSVILFLIIFLALETAAMAVLGRFVSLKKTGLIPPASALLRESTEVAVVLITTVIMAAIDRRPLRTFGFAGERVVYLASAGAICGLVILAALIGVLWTGGYLAIDGFALGGAAVYKFAGQWALVFALVGFFEESLLRGYLQHALARWMGFWGAALMLSTAFALWHAGNNGESALGLLTVGAGGFAFCLSLWYTKSLWWAMGFHAGWDWGQSYLFGTPNSGLTMEGHLLATHPVGDPLWSGGAAGPEASVLVAPMLLIAAASMWVVWGGRPKDSSPARP